MPESYTSEQAVRVEKALRKELLHQQTFLDITDDVFAKVLKITKEDLVRMRNGEVVITHDAESRELGVRLVRVSRLLSRIVHDDQAAARSWLHGQNRGLGGIPLDMIQNCSGLRHVIDYLESRQSLR